MQMCKWKKKENLRDVILPYFGNKSTKSSLCANRKVESFRIWTEAKKKIRKSRRKTENLEAEQASWVVCLSFSCSFAAYGNVNNKSPINATETCHLSTNSSGVSIKGPCYLFPLIFRFRRPRPADAYEFAQPDILSATGIMAFAFMCHHNTFLIYQSMKDSSLERWEKVTHLSVG